ncbi:MAG: mechanosensitive ion channel family protein [Holosporales bacterium]|jgi:small-conductance mechanosensitive channel|nr:mechanosensitive ion channel family protein [Holosporales bacterium]
MSKNLVYTIVWLICAALLTGSYFLADPISVSNTGVSYQIEQVVKSLIVLIFGWLTSRFVMIAFLSPLEKKRGAPLPKIVKDLTVIVIFVSVAMFVLLVIYDQSVTWLAVTLSPAMLGLVMAEKEKINDCVAGLIIDLKKSFEVGDWIKVPGGDTAKVVKIGLLETQVQAPDGITTTIYNGALVKEIFTNLSKPSPDFTAKLSVCLEQGIPVKRAARLLQAAAMSAEGVFKQQVSVFASEAAGGNVLYDIRYRVSCFGEALKVRHNVIASVTKRLAQYGLCIAEDGGIQTVIQKEASPPPHEVSTAGDVVDFISLFSECTPEEKLEITRFLTPREYAPGEVIIEEKSFGATMYFIAEGVVEVSVKLTPKAKEPKKEGEDADAKEGEEEPVKETRCHICYISNNSFFGENGVLYDSPRNAQVSAYTETLLYELTKDSLIMIVKQHPSILEKITDVIVARTQERESIKEKEKNAMNKTKDTKSAFLAAFKKFLGV